MTFDSGLSILCKAKGPSPVGNGISSAETLPRLQRAPCPLCGGQTIALPAPNPAGSVLSNGRLVGRALRKCSCLTCGAASHADDIAADEMRAIYAGGYAVADASPGSDAGRGRAYADWFASEFPPPQSVLEVGCGSAALLRELSNRWPDAACTGTDPSLSKSARSTDRLRLHRSFVEDMPADATNFDLIVAVNVIEHTASPASFLRTLQSRLAANGRIAVTCPTAELAHEELLFYDHLYSVTPQALVAALGETSLAAHRSAPAPAPLGAFRMIVFQDGQSNPSFSLSEHAFADLAAARQAYIQQWIGLDSALLARVPSAGHFAAFGGGQAAALLRAYAPRTWERLEMIILDDVSEAWTFDKPVESYANALPRLGAAAVLVAVAPRAQTMIAERLQRDGFYPIRCDDILT